MSYNQVSFDKLVKLDLLLKNWPISFSIKTFHKEFLNVTFQDFFLILMIGIGQKSDSKEMDLDES